jgi:uncharacterized protein YdaU (DUF1376 family)
MSGEAWFRFFPSDWLGGTASLSAAERGVYITLIACMYDHGGPIRREDDRLSRRCGLPKAGFVRALAALIDLGKIDEIDGCLFNSRAKIELTEREKFCSTQSGNAQSRWGKHKEKQSSSDTMALPPHCHGTATALPSHMPPQPQPHKKDLSIASQSHPKRVPGADVATAKRFYDAYPKHVDPRAAEKKFISLVKSGVDPERIISAATRFAEAHRSAGTDRQFIAAPAVWLNRGGYDSEDQPQAARAGPLPTRKTGGGYGEMLARLRGYIPDEQTGFDNHGPCFGADPPGPRAGAGAFALTICDPIDKGGGER